jgi:hypothetical protein
MDGVDTRQVSGISEFEIASTISLEGSGVAISLNRRVVKLLIFEHDTADGGMIANWLEPPHSVLRDINAFVLSQTAVPAVETKTKPRLLVLSFHLLTAYHIPYSTNVHHCRWTLTS